MAEFKVYIPKVAAILAVIYLADLFLTMARGNSWTLWRQEWHEHESARQSLVNRFPTHDACLEAKSVELTAWTEAHRKTVIFRTQDKKLSITEGNTIFEVQKSRYAGDNNYPVEMQFEIVTTMSFLCELTAGPYGLWPSYSPGFGAAEVALHRFGGEQKLLFRAKQILGE